MNREIKFRGKCLESKQWLYGSLISFIDGTRTIMFKEENNGGVTSPVDPDTVNQFTGLIDKNGAEIYEGDICKVDFTPNNNYRGTFPNRYKSMVEIQFNDCQFKAINISAKSSKNSRNWGMKWISSFEFSDFEVVGNIHEPMI